MAKDRILFCIPGNFVESFFNEEDLARLSALADVVIRNDLKLNRDEDEYDRLIRELKPRVVVTGWGSPVLRAETFRAVDELEYMCHATGSIRANVEKEAMEDGLLVTNWARMGAKPVSEGALMMILAGLRRAYQHQKAMHQDKVWDRSIGGRSLFGQRVGLHGLGYIAQELIELLKPFNCKLSGYSPHCPDEVFDKFGVKRVDNLKELYAENEIISVHASKTAANHHIVNDEILAAIPDGALLVNTARGAVIDEEALIAELKTGRIYAALDVFEKEPLPEDSPLRGIDNCLLFPHMAGVGQQMGSGIGTYAVDNIEKFLTGREVDPEAVVPASKYDLMT